MTYNELMQGFDKLSMADQNRFNDECRRKIKQRNMFGLRYGAKVQFKHSKTNVIISGTFVKMKTKYAEVMSDYNQHGLKQPYPIRWSVSPEILIPVST